MKISFLLLVTFIASCGYKPASAEGTNFLVKDNQDTVSFFFYEYYDNYKFMDKNEYDSAIFNKDAQERIPGNYKLGIIEKDRFLNRYLTFRGDSLSNFDDFNEPTDFFLKEEYNLENYQLATLENYIDSTGKFVVNYQTIVALDRESKDTLLFQEMNIIQKPNYVTFTLLTYESWDIRIEMQELLEDAVNRIARSTESNSR